MCGIVGLLIRNPAQRGHLGEWAAPILDCMGDRGADSSGIAFFSDTLSESRHRLSLFAEEPVCDWNSVRDRLAGDLDPSLNFIVKSRHALVETLAEPAVVDAWLHQYRAGVRLLGAGRSLSIYKDVGHPRELIERYGLRKAHGTHAVGHTRMATESAVSVAHSHPFTAGEDFCLVHNGSLSNPYSIRRRLERRGIRFETDNDTEAACRFLQWRMQEGDTLEMAIERGFEELDGFYTLLIGTADRLVLVRDPFACKPAVAAETDDYVAISSEYRSLAHLPGIRQAHIFEPAPERIYTWTV
jgi:methylamine---glutamate N-methyltransferase subunit A